mgnify:FL=1
MEENNNELKEMLSKSKVIEVKVKDELEKSFIAYAMAVNVSRAIPDVRDGLKPVHRRILYSMGELSLFSDKPYKKCARIVGDVMGKYHPHGDVAIYDALVRLAQDFSINCPLVDGHGNFGSVDGDSPAAQRYTEARLSKIANEMLRDIDKNTVDFYPNFDESLMQPRVLPSRFPNLLVNGSDGIAVGMATNIPPHNLKEVCDGCIAVIDNPDIEIDDLIKIIPAPDFPTRGLILGRNGIKQAYKTGKGSFLIRSRAEIEEYGNGRQRIVISEIPYQVNKAKLIIQIADLVKQKRIDGISDIKEESDREGMRIVIEVKRDANAQVVLNSLYKHTQLQVSFGVIMLALVKDTPKILNLKEIITNYIDFQKEVIIRRTQFDLDKAMQKAHILEGLVIALANIDEVIKVIKHSNDKEDAIKQLVEKFVLSEKQAQAILDMRLQRLTGLEVEKVKQELEATHNLIVELTGILNDEQKVLDIIKADLTEIKNKYGVPRKSEISLDYGDIDIADLIEEQTVVVSLTHDGYIKRMPISEYKSQHRGGVGVIAHKTKEEDFVENIYVTSTHDSLLCFSNFGRVYTLMGYEIPEAQKQSKGRAFVNLLQLSSEERITAIIPVTEKRPSGYLTMATKHGLIKKTDISEFERINKNGKIAIRLNDDDELISVHYTSGNDDIIMASSTGKCIRFNESNVRKMGRDTMGVKSMKLSPDDYIVDMSVILPNHDMLTISEYGYGKRTDQEEYRVQGRAGSGIKAGIFDDKTGRLVNLKQVTLDNDIMIIADDGTIIRVKAKEISKIGRNTKGVRIMKLKEGSKIVSVVATPSEEDEQELANNLEENSNQTNSLTTNSTDSVNSQITDENLEYAEEELNSTNDDFSDILDDTQDDGGNDDLDF